MFEQLFQHPHALARHRDGPLLEERRRYLAQGAAQQMQADMQQLKSQMDFLSQYQQQETLRLQQMKQQFEQASKLLSNIVQTHHDMANSLIQNMR